MLLIGLLLVALACLIIGLILANAVWLIGSLVASAVAGYLLFRQREHLASRSGPSKEQAAPQAAPKKEQPQSLATGKAFDSAQPADSAAGTASTDGAAPTASRPSPKPRAPEPPANAEQQVWVVDTLPQFHTQECAAIQNLDSEAIPLAQAIGDGFTECTVCKPTPSASRIEQVWVVDGRPDYHVEDCRSLKIAASQQKAEGEQIPRAQAVEDGFSPCPDCRPDGAASADAIADAPADDAPEAPAEPTAPDTVWVVDGRPRYHLAGCLIIKDQDAEEIPLEQANEDGFMACSMCTPAVQPA
jgi:hypothetical protein